MLAGIAVAGWAAFTSHTEGGTSGYEAIPPQNSQMCRLLPLEAVDSVLGGRTTYEKGIYDGDTCKYLSMETDLGYNVQLRVHREDIRAEMMEYRRDAVQEDITSTESVEVEDVGEIAALDRPDHKLDFISDGVQYELILDNNDYDDKRPSSKEDIAASAELARLVLQNESSPAQN